ncbi:MAG: DUF1249 domain-containing protein [Drouetiella hepatica Uher 2000/2452]|jgi:hypothetical protein|uniref:DUF1249 domain-containing protein n=1 Tax=Drouetiella hepatica Uher 2000/2452 TaxID=904376 RepID=A0A951UNC2_9CYAN|nr:DUF1249 domain-containing protein [Drouetiella hepatica Uher 2000/2452]
MARPVYEIIYSKLQKVLGDLSQLPDSMKLEAPGFMDLSMNVLERESDHIRIALSHYYSQNGDLVPDPDMEIRIFPESEMAEAMTYQDSYSYQEVYPTPQTVSPRLKVELNRFLNQWLTNIIDQKHKPVQSKSHTA